MSKLSSRPISASFIFSGFKISSLPSDSCREIGFIGRSNCGKSSLLNSICGSKSLAYVSRNPGRTYCLNFFHVSNNLRLVDMPGYGFAIRSKQQRLDWWSLTSDYLMHRKNLLYLFLLLDCRRLAMKIDLEVLDLLKSVAVKTYIVLTKTDLVSKSAICTGLSDLELTLSPYSVILPEMFFCSSKTGSGIDKLRKVIRLSL